MIIDSPKNYQIPELCALWREAFGDSEEFFYRFHSTAFSENRCLCVNLDGKVAAALYWFDCQYDGKKIAYLYAIATLKAYRGKGLCAALMNSAHEKLSALGYSGAILVPSEESLFGFYERFGYKTCTSVKEFEISLSKTSTPTSLVAVDKREYARLRRHFLPTGSVIQEGENLDFLEAQARLYRGDGFVLAARIEGDSLFALELLGDTDSAEKILSALGCKKGFFRTNGEGRRFSMFLPFNKKITPPEYFGLAFD